MKRNNIIITIIIIVAIVFVLILFFRPEWINKAWLWIVGLAGTIGVFFKSIFNLGSSQRIRDVDASNKEIKAELKLLEEKIQQTNKRMELERELYKKDIELLEQKIEAKQKELEAIRSQRKSLENISWEEYFRSLPESKRKKILNKMEENTGPFIN